MIELIVVIVILGILAATALPKFIDLGSDAMKSAVEGVAGNLSSGMTLNYAGCSAVAHDAVNRPDKCRKVANCTDAAALLMGGLANPFTLSGTQYTVQSAALSPNGATGTCTLDASKGSATSSAAFPGISAGN